MLAPPRHRPSRFSNRCGSAPRVVTRVSPGDELRVLLIANTLPHTDISGVGEQVVQLATGLGYRGHEVRILGRGSAGAKGPKLLFPLTILPAAFRSLHQFRPHIVQVHESDGALAALMVRTLQAVLDPVPRLVALLQVSYREEMRAVRSLRSEGRILGRPGAVEWLFRWIKAPVQVVFGSLTAWLAEEILAPSQQTATEIERDYGVSGVKVLPNVTGPREGEDLEIGDDLPNSGYLLFVGRLRIRKGVEVLLHAIERLRRVHADVRLLIVGGGEHAGRVADAVSQLNLESEVELLGPCRPEQIPALMDGARALVVPSIYEGMPLVILEAMAAGLPVVASRVSGIPEVVQSGASGWLVPPEDIGALELALAEVYDDPEEARRRGCVGRSLVETASTPTDAAHRWLELVETGSGGEEN